MAQSGAHHGARHLRATTITATATATATTPTTIGTSGGAAEDVQRAVVPLGCQSQEGTRKTQDRDDCARLLGA